MYIHIAPPLPNISVNMVFEQFEDWDYKSHNNAIALAFYVLLRIEHHIWHPSGEACHPLWLCIVIYID